MGHLPPPRHLPPYLTLTLNQATRRRSRLHNQANRNLASRTTRRPPRWTRDSKGREFESWVFRFQVTILGKLFTLMCLCHQAILVGTGQGAVMPYESEYNRRSGVVLAMRHRRRWFIHLRAHSLRKGVEHCSPRTLLMGKKGSPYSITERRVPELIPVLNSQPAGDMSHKPGGRLPLLSARPTVTLATLKRAVTNFAAR